MSKAGIFLSHSHHDKSFARRLAHDLARHGVRAWVDEAEMMVGDSLLAKISAAIAEIEYLGAIISAHSVQSHWVSYELQLAMTTELQLGRVKVLPLLIDACKVPDFLVNKVYADFRNPAHYDAAFEMLLRRIAGESSAAPSEASYDHLVDQRFREAAADLDVPPSRLYHLPANALLALLLRCCNRCKMVLFANWRDGNYMWDVFFNPLSTLIEPGFKELLTSPKLSGRRSFLERVLKIENEALAVVTSKPHRVSSPEVVIRALKIWICLTEFALGETGLAQDVFYGAYSLFWLMNPDNAVCRKAMLDDLRKLEEAAQAKHWTDSSPIDPEGFWEYEWDHDPDRWPILYKESLQQKVSWLTSFHKM